MYVCMYVSVYNNNKYGALYLRITFKSANFLRKYELRITFW